MTSLRVTTAGPLSTVQDLGRPGFAAVGVSRSGALDRGALALANRLIGNAEGAAGLEITVGGFSCVFDADVWIAVTGAWGRATAGGQPIDINQPVRLAAGTSLEIGMAEAGLRYYLAVGGGIEVPPVLGSRSTDLLSGTGPAVLKDGDALPLGHPHPEAMRPVDISPWGPPDLGPVTVPLYVGPRADWFTSASLETLFTTTWKLSPASNRVGARLDGIPLQRSAEALGRGELPSEGMVAGALQVPPSGLPTVLLADHPTTGGYPVIAVVASAALDRFAQLRPGQEVRFRHGR
ncbi:biotin-dependent carboxyltransferase family protein [Mycetocola zhadangensis]|uniref:Biotin-dependent carboxyltransferase n=1 Tax=Mycetocola zhadangensis TaxID=1164595 RepID=A0A3L7J498_9MICO|nr:biotin-dependent carboxyltransferase family protein [Mycetocola zhadangensis]RLQ85344.1 biotin-dependent carboxyltransferase [Mycetocola zhadangensis]GGE81827.1 allophanate hydrolase [Mycetocola zhadangensis]